MKFLYITFLQIVCGSLFSQPIITYQNDKNGGREMYITTPISAKKVKSDLRYDEWNLEVRYANGQIKKLGKYLMGMRQGEWKHFFEDGTLAFQGTFNNGVGIGIHRHFFHNGKNRKIRTYENSSPTDFTITYNSNGDTASLIVYENGEKVKDVIYNSGVVTETNYQKRQKEGVFLIRNKAGLVLERGSYTNNLKLGEWLCFDEKGEVTASYIYTEKDTAKELQLKSICNATPNEVDSGKVFVIVEKSPEFEGGENAMLSFLSRNINYPNYSRDNDYQGKVLLFFEVSDKGKVEYIEPRGNMPYSELTDEAIRVLELMPDFKPGYQQGKAVRVQYVIPVFFRLM